MLRLIYDNDGNNFVTFGTTMKFLRYSWLQLLFIQIMYNQTSYDRSKAVVPVLFLLCVATGHFMFSLALLFVLMFLQSF